MIYVSSSSSGTAGGVSFKDEDILTYDTNTGTWSMYFDGSDVGVGSSADIKAFTLLSDGSLLMSFNKVIDISGLGTVDDSDIVRFIPTSLGSNTTGSFEMYLDGSSVGLTTNGEDIDAIGFTPGGKLVVSTVGSFSVPGASGKDEDLIELDDVNGTWSLYFDGSDVELTTSDEDVRGIYIDSGTEQVYLTTKGPFAVSGVSGDESDIFICTPSSLGETTACAFAMFWDGSANGFDGEVIDAFAIGP